MFANVSRSKHTSSEIWPRTYLLLSSLHLVQFSAASPIFARSHYCTPAFVHHVYPSFLVCLTSLLAYIYVFLDSCTHTLPIAASIPAALFRGCVLPSPHSTPCFLSSCAHTLPLPLRRVLPSITLPSEPCFLVSCTLLLNVLLVL